MIRRALSGKRPTQADVARAAGVSQAMVSYVLNANPSVSVPEGTRQRVLEAARQLGYVPNNTARGLRTSRTYTIASLIPDITNPFYPALQRAIQDVAERHSYNLILYNTDGQAAKEQQCLHAVQQARVEGIIAVLFHLTARDLLPLLARGVAVVRIEATPKRARGAHPLDNLYVDNEAAAFAAVSYLIGRGHRRIGMVVGQQGPGPARREGYHRALAAQQIDAEDDLIWVDSFSEESGYRGMQALLATPRPPTAVFAAADVMAIGALAALKDAGLRVPQDVAVMGFDDIPTARLLSPALTTVAQFQHRLGQRAAEMLFERLTGVAPAGGRSEEIPYQIVVRESA